MAFPAFRPRQNSLESSGLIAQCWVEQRANAHDKEAKAFWVKLPDPSAVRCGYRPADGLRIAFPCTGTPEWTNDVAFDKDVFTFVRVRYIVDGTYGFGHTCKSWGLCSCHG